MSAATLPMACVMGDMDLVRALGLARVPCAAVAKPGAAPRGSRFVRSSLPWVDAWEDPGAMLEVLLAFAATQPLPPVLFYEEDRGLLLVSRNRERLAGAFRFVLADAELVEDLVDKSRFQRLAERLALPVPASRRLDPATLSGAADVDLRFPLIVKPLTRRPERWDPIAGGAKALQVETMGELRTLWPRLVDAGVSVLAQERVPGSEARIESYHVYVDALGKVAGEFTGRKIRTYPQVYGDSTALVITDDPGVRALGRELVERLGLRGVAKFDFKRGPDGRLHLLEVNPRFTLWSHPGAVAGVNLPELVYRDLVGLPRRAARPARAGVRWCRVWRDHAAARDAGVSTAAWLRWVLTCEAKCAMAWDDPVPVLYAGLWRCLHRHG